MELAHSQVSGVEMAVNLANTSRERNGGKDDLDSIAALQAFADSHLLKGTAVVDDDLGKVVRIRARMLEVLVSEEMEVAAARLNGLLEQAPALPRLRRHDGLDWHIDWYVDGVSFPDHLAAQMSVGLMEHLMEHGFTRIGVCGADDCERFFVDQTRNRSKRFCDGRNCGGRVHARAFRLRQR